MTKELEALEEIKNYIDDNITTKYNHVEPEFKIIESALKRLESIDNSNPSEILEKLAFNKFNKYITDLYKHRNDYNKKKNLYEFQIDNAIIRSLVIKEIYNKFKEVMDNE